MAWIRRIGFFLALGFLILTFVNASWLADAPKGRPQLLAVRGVSQLPTAPVGPGECHAQKIEAPAHDLIENTLASMQRADNQGAAMVSVDVGLSADGRIVMLRETALDCQTDGKGDLRSASLAQLKSLDLGHGFTADGGKTFPLRGTGRGQIPTLEEVLQLSPGEPILFNLSGQDGAVAAKLIEGLAAAGRDVEKLGDGFMGDDAVIAPIRQRWPKAWAFSLETARRSPPITNGKAGWG